MAEGPYQTRHPGPQPTALTARIDLSASPSRASAAGRRAFSARWSIDAGGWVNRTEKCVCRGRISVPFPCPDNITAAIVKTHNGSLLHVVWRARMFAADYWRAAA